MIVLGALAVVIGGVLAFCTIVDLIVLTMEGTDTPYLFWRDTIWKHLVEWFAPIFQFWAYAFRWLTKSRVWASKPAYQVEYFGKRIHWEVTDYKSRSLDKQVNWEWRKWEKDKLTPFVFTSEKKAVKAFKKSRVYKECPYVQFRVNCLVEGKTFVQARAERKITNAESQQKALAQYEADRLEYRENYVKHLEDELARWKDSVE